MSGLNKVMLIGRLGKPPALRWLESGQAMCKLSIATSERYKDKSGKTHERTEWHKVVMWRETAELADRLLDTGHQVFVEGRLRSRTWQDAEGVEHRSTEIVADRFELLSHKGTGQSEGQIPNAAGHEQTTTPRGPQPMEGDDLPF